MQKINNFLIPLIVSFISFQHRPISIEKPFIFGGFKCPLYKNQVLSDFYYSGCNFFNASPEDRVGSICSLQFTFILDFKSSIKITSAEDRFSNVGVNSGVWFFHAMLDTSSALKTDFRYYHQANFLNFFFSLS